MNGKDVFDSLDGWPTVKLIDPEPPMNKLHKGETQVEVKLTPRHALSFFVNDDGLEALRLAIVERQKIRNIQKITSQLEPDGHCTNCSRSERCGGMGNCR